MEVLQTSALPLGYVAVMPILAYSRWAVKVAIRRDILKSVRGNSDGAEET